jgi:hypothetical protein
MTGCFSQWRTTKGITTRIAAVFCASAVMASSGHGKTRTPAPFDDGAAMRTRASSEE